MVIFRGRESSHHLDHLRIAPDVSTSSLDLGSLAIPVTGGTHNLLVVNSYKHLGGIVL